MRILVTGGSGKLGRATIDDLLAHGHQIANLDMNAPREARCRFMRVDFSDTGQAIDAFSFTDVDWDRADALVHLAAIPGHTHAPDAHLFKNNFVSTFNVFHAARRVGIRNIVWASSETLQGVPFAVPPAYVPMDEASTPMPQSTYALAKHLEEEMARQFCRWDPALKMIGLRFSYVMDPQDYARFPALDHDPMAQHWNLWSYIDARDAAQAVRLALDHPTPGMDTFLIASPDTVMSRPTAELMSAVFPGVPVRAPLGTHQSLLSCEKARRVLGYRPVHGWR